VFVALIFQEVRTEGEGDAQEREGKGRERKGGRRKEEDRSGDEWSSGRS
jgi:hypothetical protein